MSTQRSSNFHKAFNILFECWENVRQRRVQTFFAKARTGHEFFSKRYKKGTDFFAKARIFRQRHEQRKHKKEGGLLGQKN